MGADNGESEQVQLPIERENSEKSAVLILQIRAQRTTGFSAAVPAGTV
jgi:hypothetical protein